MRKILATLSLLFIPASLLLAQDEKVNENATPAPIVKPARDFIMLQVAWNNWQNRPDSIKTKPFGYDFNGYLCYDFPIKKSKMSFAAGVGIHTSTVWLDKQVITFADTLGQARFLTDTNGNKRSKFSTTYLQAPFELRYFGNSNNRNKGFKAAIGMQVGTLLGGHTKELRGVDGANVKFKVNTKRYISPWNFAATARIGWGNFSLFGSYNLTSVFKDNQGPEITPMSVGICLTGL
jgi:hypothetical protein